MNRNCTLHIITRPFSLFRSGCIVILVILSASSFAARSSPTDSLYVKITPDLDTSGSWINRSGPSVKFFIRKDEVYKITKAWLESAGINTATVDPATVKLFRKGKEVSLLPVNLDAGAFTDSSYFLFYGYRNYTEDGYRHLPVRLDDPYPEYLDRYSDSTAYWLFFGTGKGKRYNEATFNHPLPLDTLTWSRELLHHEEDRSLEFLSTNTERLVLPDWTSEDTWIEDWLNPGQSLAFPFEIDNLNPAAPARLLVKVASYQGRRDIRPNHRVRVSINDGPALDSSTFNLGEQVLISTLVPAGMLRNGIDSMRLESINVQETGHSRVVFDWFDVEYPRYLVARDNRISVTVDDAIAGTPMIVSIDSFTTTDILILRLDANGGAVLAPLSVSGTNPYRLLFVDTLRRNARYLVRPVHDLNEPPPGTRTIVADLRNPSQQAEYLAVTTRAFHAAVENYTEFIRREYRVTTRVVDVEDIYDNYSFGIFNPESIKLFMRDVLRSWKDTPPRWLFLVGDANYNYKNTLGKFSANYVPSYGFPVSDSWFVSFDSLALYPRLAVGRLPVASSAGIITYKAKHEAYLRQPVDLWNKTTLHMTGGDYNEPESVLQGYRLINNRVINHLVLPDPLAGRATHLYKTADPPSNFGPFPEEFVKQTIDEGGIIVSYVGHSATRYWDNGITDAAEVRNRYGRYGLVTDFGCASGRFAEPDVQPFSEDFVLPLENHAICYIGNTAFGFISAGAELHYRFYEALIRNRSESIGEAHADGKRELLRTLGVTPSTRVEIQINTLVGDPIVKLTLPEKPNPVVRDEWIIPATEIFTDGMDSLRFAIAVANFGLRTDDSLRVLITDYRQGKEAYTLSRMIALPRLVDTVHVAVPVEREAGERRLEIRLDPDRRLDEISEDDNVAAFSYTVLGTYLRAANAPLEYASGSFKPVRILNPVVSPGNINGVRFEFDANPEFLQPVVVSAPFGKTVTTLDTLPSNLPPGGSWFWRAALDQPDPVFIDTYRFHDLRDDLAFVQRDSIDLAQNQVRGVVFRNGALTLPPSSRHLRLSSAGRYDGNSGGVFLDGINLLPDSIFSGFGVAVLDSSTLRVLYTGIYETASSPAHADSLATLLQTISSGRFVAIVAADDPAANLEKVRAPLRSLGSVFIDSVQPNSSWALLGRKGAAPGTAPEAFARVFTGKAIIDTVIEARADTGFVISPWAGPASRWKYALVKKKAALAGNVLVSVFAKDSAGKDTVVVRDMAKDSISLTDLDAATYPRIRLAAKLIPSPNQDRPVLDGWSIAYERLPELTLNYQSVWFETDTLDFGDVPRLHLGILNTGESPSGAFTVSLDQLGPGQVRTRVLTTSVGNLQPDQWFDTTLNLPSMTTAGRFAFITSADASDDVHEQFESNNVFITTLLVRRDTTRPQLKLTIDGTTPVNGDFISPAPEIAVVLEDKDKAAIPGPSAFIITLDDSLVSPGDPRLEFIPGPETGSGRVLFHPVLGNGEHKLTVNGRDASGNLALDDPLLLNVVVETNRSIANVYNYPNPLSDKTTFTFILTGTEAPNEVELKIYTVNGRLIRKEQYPGGSFRIGFNTIRWDGRDQDGDPLANGVYFYKIVARYTDTSVETINRLAVLR